MRKRSCDAHLNLSGAAGTLGSLRMRPFDVRCESPPDKTCHRGSGRTGRRRFRLREVPAVNAARLPATWVSKETPSPHPASTAAACDGSAHATGSALSECVSRTVNQYLVDIGDTSCADGLHALVIREVEGPLLREVLAFHDGNQSRAAGVLGINRATLRKKLALHGLL